MGVQRFVGSNNREAMGRVRAALGDDALILANRATDQGVEILALAEDDSSGYAPSEQAVPDRAGQAAVAPGQPRRQFGGGGGFAHPGGADQGDHTDAERH